MDNCRICLAHRKRYNSIFETPKSLNNIVYARMITAIANVQISKNDGCSENICFACSHKLQEAYDFKLLIERSDASCNKIKNNKIVFNNINDIKVEIDLKTEIEDVKPNEAVKLNFEENDAVKYNNTIIKKVKVEYVDEDLKKPISILEFLNNFKEEAGDSDDAQSCDMDHHIDDCVPSNDDEDYSPTKENKKSYVKKAKHTIQKNKDPNKKEKQILIKPTFMRELKYVPTKGRPRLKVKKSDRCLDLVCPYCGKLIKKHYFNLHLLTHTAQKNVKCDFKNCSKRFYNHSELDNHKVKHTFPNRYKCDHCYANFFDKSGLSSHMLKHSEAKQFVCNVCNKAFKRRGAMNRHIKMHNVNNKNFKCESCMMSFYTNANLRHHMRVHTGERPYNCELCSQPYSYRRDFTRHCYKKHGVFLKRRAVNVLNQEVLIKEMEIMNKLKLRAEGVLDEGEPLIPFVDEGPQAVLAFEMAINALKTNDTIKF